MPVSVERNGAIAVVTVDNPPVNALSRAVRADLFNAARDCAADPAIETVVLLCKGRTFIAGADIREFGSKDTAPLLPEVIAAIESAATPWIAALFGNVLGGGLEVTLGCHYRIALPSTCLGLPEITLGIVPGAGGTQRLPRLIGVEKSLEMIVTGRPISAREAAETGLVDRLIDGDLREAALTFADSVRGKPAQRLADRSQPVPPHPGYWREQEDAIAGRARGQVSPLRALEAVRAACELPIAEGLVREREIFQELKQSEQVTALRHVFFAERAVSKITMLENVAPRPVENAAVIGGGTMGTGIAAALIDADIPVTLVERDAGALDRGLANLRRVYTSAMRKGRITEAEMERRLGGVVGATDYAALAGADLVIEAAFEDIDVKQAIFRRLDSAMKPGAILATNTSYLDMNAIAAATARPADVLGLHFFSPAHIMKLVEIVQAGDTAPDVLATGFALAKRLGKIGVLAGVCEGFIGNRILKVYRRQADYLLEDGCLPQEIDAAMRAFGFAMGPYEAQDLGGLDIAWANRKRQAVRRGPGERYVAIADRLCEVGRFGQKSGAGWYRYENGSRRPIPDPEVEAIILDEAKRNDITRRIFDQDEIQRRILWAMINEGARILEEGIARRPLDIDIVEIHGYGFPRWRGGLMHYADSIGLDRILDDIQSFSVENPAIWKPSDLLAGLVRRTQTFATL